MKNLLFCLFFIPLTGFTGGYICGNWTPTHICDGETGDLNQAYVDEMFRNGFWIHQEVIHEDAMGDFLRKYREITFRNKAGKTIFAQCEQACPWVEECPPDLALGALGECVPITGGPFVCQNWAEWFMCDSETGSVLDDYIQNMADIGQEYSHVRETVSIKEFPHENPPTTVLYNQKDVYFTNRDGDYKFQGCTQQCPTVTECPDTWAPDALNICREPVCPQGTEPVGENCEPLPVVIDPPVIEDPPPVEDPPIVDEMELRRAERRRIMNLPTEERRAALEKAALEYRDALRQAMEERQNAP